MPTAHSNLDRVLDSALVLRPTASAAIAVTTAGAEGTNIDLGPGYHMFDVFFDVTAIDVAGGDELYRIKIQGSNDATPFSSTTINLAELVLGDATVLAASNDRATGEYVLPCHNIGKDSTGADQTWRYIRVAWGPQAGATVNLDFTAHIVKRT